ncbi:MAG TPA: protein kinase, partial [Pseudomonadota bacterium]|nr:protein kinase [Pseudomonadota bacterium]
MAPELWHSGSHRAQPSSDLFSFGVIAFELLTSVLPFLQPPVFAYAQKQTLRIAKLATSRSELPPKLCALVDSCLSENPAARPSARVVVEQLRELGAPTPMSSSG